MRVPLKDWLGVKTPHLGQYSTVILEIFSGLAQPGAQCQGSGDRRSRMCQEAHRFYESTCACAVLSNYKLQCKGKDCLALQLLKTVEWGLPRVVLYVTKIDHLIQAKSSEMHDEVLALALALQSIKTSLNLTCDSTSHCNTHLSGLYRTWFINNMKRVRSLYDTGYRNARHHCKSQEAITSLMWWRGLSNREQGALLAADETPNMLGELHKQKRVKEMHRFLVRQARLWR